MSRRHIIELPSGIAPFISIIVIWPVLESLPSYYLYIGLITITIYGLSHFLAIKMHKKYLLLTLGQTKLGFIITILIIFLLFLILLILFLPEKYIASPIAGGIFLAGILVCTGSLNMIPKRYFVLRYFITDNLNKNSH